jgi:hypothetical protein
MDTTQEEVSTIANYFTILIDKVKNSGKSMYDYLKNDFLSDMGKELAAKTLIILVVTGYVYTEFLFRYGYLSNPNIVTRMAYYQAVAAGSKIASELDENLTYLAATYAILSNLSTILESLEVTIDEVKEIMNLLNAPQEDFDNLNDSQMYAALQGLDVGFPSIAMTLDGLGGVKNG